MLKDLIPTSVRKPLTRTRIRFLSAAGRTIGSLSPYETLIVVPKDAFVADGLATEHDSSFSADDNFRRGYARAIKAVGGEWRIPWRTHVAIWAADVCRSTPGDFVELGTGRGWMFSAVLGSMDWASMTKRLFLFDMFTSGRVDPITGRELEDSTPHPCYALSYEATKANFSEWDRVELVRGRIPESLDNVELPKIAFMHIDLNNADSEVGALRLLWPRLSTGAFVLLDDYAYRGYRPQYDAMNALGRELGFKVLSLPTGQGLICKSAQPPQ